MMDSITSFVIGLLLFGPVIVFFGHIIVKDIKALVDEYIPEPEVVVQEEVHDENEYEAFILVSNAYNSLKNQHACGYGPWLSCIIDRSYQYEIVRDERGWAHVVNAGTCPPKIALAAMIKTRKELLQSRFDISEINRAIALLKRM